MVLEELKIPSEKPMKLYCDNKVTINVAHNWVQYDRTKHVEVHAVCSNRKTASRHPHQRSSKETV